jgi:hypothetical protein
MVISQELYIFLVTSSIIGLTFACISIILASYAAIQVVGMRNSTHQIQYVPVDEEIEAANKEYWATDSSVLEKEQNLYNEQLKDDMPEFALDEEDKKTFSF